MVILLSFIESKKVGENLNKLACGVHLPAVALTHKNELLKYIENPWFLVLFLLG